MIDNKIDIKKILVDICGDESVLEEGIDLIESGLLDSYAFIELFTILEDYNIYIHPTRIDRSKLHSVDGIEQLVQEVLSNK